MYISVDGHRLNFSRILPRARLTGAQSGRNNFSASKLPSFFHLPNEKVLLFLRVKNFFASELAFQNISVFIFMSKLYIFILHCSIDTNLS